MRPYHETRAAQPRVKLLSVPEHQRGIRTIFYDQNGREVVTVGMTDNAAVWIADRPVTVAGADVWVDNTHLATHPFVRNLDVGDTLTLGPLFDEC